MVLSKSRWQWHQCLQAKRNNQRSLPSDTDSENEDEECTFKSSDNYSSAKHHQRQTDETLIILQDKLKEEAKTAFLYGARMAKMQVELERSIRETKKVSIYRHLGIENYDQQPLTRSLINRLNIGQLQMMIHSLYYQIDASNEQLVHLLIERDTLSMEQDSILVDIEDLTKRVQERLACTSKANDRKSIYSYFFKHSSSNPSFFQSFFCKATHI